MVFKLDGVKAALRFVVDRGGGRLRQANGFGPRQLVFFGFLDVDEVGGNHALGFAFGEGLALIEPERTVAELLDDIERMRHQENRLVAAPKLRKLVETLHRERLVTDGQHLVDEQHLWVDVNRDGEPEPHVHARRVGLDRCVDEVFELGEFHDFVKALHDFALRQAEHDAVDEDVFAARDLGMKACAELDERRDAAVDGDRAFVGPGNAGDALEERGFARSVSADDAVGAAFGHAEGDAAKRGEGFVRLQIADQAAFEQGGFERGELLAPRVSAIDLGDVDDFMAFIEATTYTFFCKAVPQSIEHKVSGEKDAERSRQQRHQPLPVPVRSDVEEHLLIRDRQVCHRVEIEKPLGTSPAPVTWDK